VTSSKKRFGLFGKDVAQGRITPAGRLMLDQVLLAKTFDFDGEIVHEKKQKSRKQKTEIKTGKAEIWKTESRRGKMEIAKAESENAVMPLPEDMVLFFVFSIFDFTIFNFYFLIS
jgi:hypothetical protein